MLCSIAGHLTQAETAGGIITLILSLLMLGIVVPFNATTQIKNSGILRYTFGTGAGGNTPPVPQFDLIEGQNTPGEAKGTLIQILGANANVDCDIDNQIFGLCPGYAAITGATSSLFSGSNVAAANGVAPGKRVNYPGNTNNLYDQYIPAGTKVHAYFVMVNAILGASTVIAEQPTILVQTEVKTNRIYRAGVPDANGPQYVSSIRVAVKNIGAATTYAAGVLVIELQHSEHDLPGSAGNQDQFFLATIIT